MHRVTFGQALQELSTCCEILHVGHKEVVVDLIAT